MSRSRDHFRRVFPLLRAERRLLAALAERPDRLRPEDIARLRYGLVLGRMGEIRGDAGETVDLFEAVAPFRHWVIDELERSVDPSGRRPVDWKGVNAALPELTRRAGALRADILRHEANRLSEARLEDEIIHPQLVLVLGGGGGAGYAHLGLFATIAELGLTPSLLVGSSMGALMGLFRSLRRDYDPMLLALALPKPSEFTRVFGPYPGYSVFGFPGTFEFRLRSLAAEAFQTVLGEPQPAFGELPIPLRVLGTGLRTGLDLALNEVENEIGRAKIRFTPLALRRRFLLFQRLVRSMVENPRFLGRVVFGGPGLESFDLIDAVGYSCAVPGLIHFDNYSPDTASARTLRDLFATRGFFRMTDGGIVSNVSARTGWDTVQEGALPSRNAFILAVDAFAPQLVAGNLPWVPVQRLARASVEVDAPFADLMLTWRTPPSPLRVLQGWDRLQAVIADGRAQIRDQRRLIAFRMSPLPRWSALCPVRETADALP